MTSSRAQRRRVITGNAQLRSPWFSSVWRLIADGDELAELRRHGKMHVSVATLAARTEWLIEPAGWGTVRAMEGTDEVGRIERHSAWGRRWGVEGFGFAYELVSDPRPRSWRVEIGSSPVAQLRGSLISYNTLDVETGLSLPLVAVLLAWHVVARPWEAAAAPRGLIPAGRPADGRVG